MSENLEGSVDDKHFFLNKFADGNSNSPNNKSSTCSIELNLREYSSMNYLLKQIPKKGQKGLNVFNIELTCVASCVEFIILGSNVGIIYLYDRREHHLIRLRCEDYVGPITCVEIAKLEDFLIASGTKDGRIFCHKISTNHLLQESFIIRGIHKETINTLEWSQNAEKLFSGDNGGYVVCTIMQYEETVIPTSYLLIEENYPIIQLAYSYCKLLVGTTDRCLLYNEEVQQIGKQKRKCLGKYGITFFPTSDTNDYVIYSARPNLHLWKCSSDGKVIETIILKEAIKKCISNISLLNCQQTLPPENVQLGLLKLYCERYFITWNETSMIIIDPDCKEIVGCCWDFNNIIDLTVCQDEIFLLLEDRHLIRIANNPENNKIDTDIQEDPLLTSIINPIKQFKNSWTKTLGFPIGKIKLIPQSNQIFGWLSENYAENRKVESSITRITDDTNNDKHFEMDNHNRFIKEIANSDSENFENTLKVNNTTDEISEDIQNNQKNLTEKIFVDRINENLDDANKSIDESNNLNNLPTIEYDKNFSSLNKREPLSLEEILSRYQNYNKENEEISNSCKMVISPNSNIDDNISKESEELFIQKENEIQSIEIKDSVEIEPQLQNNLKITNEELSKNNVTKNRDHSELKTETDTSQNIQTQNNNRFDSDKSKEYKNSDLNDPDKDLKSSSIVKESLIDYADIWIQDKAPDLLISLAACNQYLYCVDINGKVWHSSLSGLCFSWIKTTKEANQIAVSSSGNVISLLFKGTVYIALFTSKERNLSFANWKIIAENINYIAVDEHSIWLINNNGELYVQQHIFIQQRTSKLTHIFCCYPLIQVTSRDSCVCVLTVSGKILFRTGITDYKIEGSGWREIKLAENMVVSSCVIGSKDLLWIVDDQCKIWFQHSISKIDPSEINLKWWQIDMSNLIYQYDNETLLMKEFASSMLSITNLSKSAKSSNIEALLMKEFASKFSITNLPKNAKSTNICPYICTNDKGVWYCELPGKIIHSNRKEIIGHHWRKIKLETTTTATFIWKYISSESLALEKGVIWGLLKDNKFLCFSNESTTPLSFQPPDLNDEICCLTSAPGALWILTSLGKIFIRTEISCIHPEGIDWIKLDLSQLSNVHLVHISCGKNVVWACDKKGICYFRAGPLSLSSVQTLHQAWIPLDLNAEHEMRTFVKDKTYDPTKSSALKIQISKIYSGQNYFMVWAIDDKHNIYVREGIFPDLPIGTGWVYVKGIKARQLCLARNFVWAVTLTGDIYCRFGITDKNYIGDYWKKIPGNVISLSAGFDGKLWAIDSNGALYHHETYVIKQSSVEFKSITSTVIEKVQEEDWEFL